jgi:hypothetical protein
MRELSHNVWVPGGVWSQFKVKGLSRLAVFFWHFLGLFESLEAPDFRELRILRDFKDFKVLLP